MKRKIIEIDEKLCNGCGECITGCSEGALALVDGKARLVKEQYCDGFGDCVGTCPTGALRIIEKDVPAFDIDATREHVLQHRGGAGVHAMIESQKKHMGGCPGMMSRTLDPAPAVTAAAETDTPSSRASALRQWPVQIHLVNAESEFFKNKELVIISTCAPLAMNGIHERFIKGRSVLVGCPKLDRTEGYVEKTAAILAEPSIPTVKVLRMEVPCCGGLTHMLQQAVILSGREDLMAEEVTVSLQGEVTSVRTL